MDNRSPDRSSIGKMVTGQNVLDTKISLSRLIFVLLAIGSAVIYATYFVQHANVSNRQIEELIEMGKQILETNNNNISANKVIDIQRGFFDYLAFTLRNTPYPGVDNYTRYTVARLGLTPLTKESLVPEFGPVINDVLSFWYPISIASCDQRQEKANNRSVFVAIPSAPNNFVKRDIIRKTWINHLMNKSNAGDVTCWYGFFVGLTENDSTQNQQIEEEHNKYGDIIQIEMSDFYRNLSLKMAAVLNWMYRNCPKVDFLFKVDDDVYVDVRNLIHFVQSYSHIKMSIFGVPSEPFVAEREYTAKYRDCVCLDGKWDITFEDWPWSTYPSYLGGPAYLIHGSAILTLLAAGQTTPMTPFEDLYVTGICAEKSGLHIYVSTNSTSVFGKGMSASPSACDQRHFISWLTASADHMNSSHLATDEFYYNNMTDQCTKSESNGTNLTAITEPIQFYFNKLNK